MEAGTAEGLELARQYIEEAQKAGYKLDQWSVEGDASEATLLCDDLVNGCHPLRGAAIMRDLLQALDLKIAALNAEPGGMIILRTNAAPPRHLLAMLADAVTKSMIDRGVTGDGRVQVLVLGEHADLTQMTDAQLAEVGLGRLPGFTPHEGFGDWSKGESLG